MVAALSHLLDVQRIDGKIDTLEKQRTAVSAKLNELKQKVDAVKLQLSQLDAQIGEKDKERRIVETNVQLDVVKLKKWELRLGEIRNQREFLALSREIEGQKKQNTEGQEKGNLLASEVRTLESKREALRDEVAELEVDMETEQAAVDAKLQDLMAELSVHQKEKAEFLTQIPAAILKRYDMVRQRRGTGLAPVSGGRCTACNMGLPPQLYNIICRGETIESCPSCHRFLFKRDEEKQADATTP